MLVLLWPAVAYCGLWAGKGLKVYTSNPASQILSGALPPELIEATDGKAPVLELSVVRQGDTLDLGGGEKLALTYCYLVFQIVSGLQFCHRS